MDNPDREFIPADSSFPLVICRGWISLGSGTRIIRNPKSPTPQNPEISPSKIQISEITNPPKNEKSRNPESRIQPPATRIWNHEI